MDAGPDATSDSVVPSQFPQGACPGTQRPQGAKGIGVPNIPDSYGNGLLQRSRYRWAFTPQEQCGVCSSPLVSALPSPLSLMQEHYLEHFCHAILRGGSWVICSPGELGMRLGIRGDPGQLVRQVEPVYLETEKPNVLCPVQGQTVIKGLWITCIRVWGRGGIGFLCENLQTEEQDLSIRCVHCMSIQCVFLSYFHKRSRWVIGTLLEWVKDLTHGPSFAHTQQDFSIYMSLLKDLHIY